MTTQNPSRPRFASCPQIQDVEIVGGGALGSGYIGTGALVHSDSVRMDLAMPEINGLEATRRIKAFAGAPRVIILTLYDNPEYRTTAAAAGADGFIAKSELTTQLLPLIHYLFADSHR